MSDERWEITVVDGEARAIGDLTPSLPPVHALKARRVLVVPERRALDAEAEVERLEALYAGLLGRFERLAERVRGEGEVEALRAERDRLREAVEGLRSQTPGFEADDAYNEAVDDVLALLNDGKGER